MAEEQAGCEQDVLGEVVVLSMEDDSNSSNVDGKAMWISCTDIDSNSNDTCSNLGDEIPKSIYFGGCCWGASFYVGVYRAMWKRWGPDFRHKCLITGDSAGSVFAVGIALGRTPDQMCELYRTMSEMCAGGNFLGAVGGFMDTHLRGMLQEYPNAYRELEGKLRFGVTVFPFTHVWHDRWDSNEHLLQECRCSYHMPIYCGRPPMSMYGYVVDGAYGFAGHDTPHGDETLFIGIDPHAEITREFTNEQMFYPALGDDYTAIVQSGYDAFMNWKGHRLRKVGSRTPNHQALYVLWVLKLVEILIDMLEYIYVLASGAIYRQTRAMLIPVDNNRNSRNGSNNGSTSSTDDDEVSPKVSVTAASVAESHPLGVRVRTERSTTGKRTD